MLAETSGSVRMKSTIDVAAAIAVNAQSRKYGGMGTSRGRPRKTWE